MSHNNDNANPEGFRDDVESSPLDLVTQICQIPGYSSEVLAKLFTSPTPITELPPVQEFRPPPIFYYSEIQERQAIPLAHGSTVVIPISLNNNHRLRLLSRMFAAHRFDVGVKLDARFPLGVSAKFKVFGLPYVPSSAELKDPNIVNWPGHMWEVDTSPSFYGIFEWPQPDYLQVMSTEPIGSVVIYTIAYAVTEGSPNPIYITPTLAPMNARFAIKTNVRAEKIPVPPNYDINNGISLVPVSEFNNNTKAFDWFWRLLAVYTPNLAEAFFPGSKDLVRVAVDAVWWLFDLPSLLAKDVEPIMTSMFVPAGTLVRISNVSNYMCFEFSGIEGTYVGAIGESEEDMEPLPYTPPSGTAKHQPIVTTVQPVFNYPPSNALGSILEISSELQMKWDSRISDNDPLSYWKAAPLGTCLFSAIRSNGSIGPNCVGTYRQTFNSLNPNTVTFNMVDDGSTSLDHFRYSFKNTSNRLLNFSVGYAHGIDKSISNDYLLAQSVSFPNIYHEYSSQLCVLGYKASDNYVMHFLVFVTPQILDWFKAPSPIAVEDLNFDLFFPLGAVDQTTFTGIPAVGLRAPFDSEVWDAYLYASPDNQYFHMSTFMGSAKQYATRCAGEYYLSSDFTISLVSDSKLPSKIVSRGVRSKTSSLSPKLVSSGIDAYISNLAIQQVGDTVKTVEKSKESTEKSVKVTNDQIPVKAGGTTQAKLLDNSRPAPVIQNTTLDPLGHSVVNVAAQEIWTQLLTWNNQPPPDPSALVAKLFIISPYYQTTFGSDVPSHAQLEALRHVYVAPSRANGGRATFGKYRLTTTANAFANGRLIMVHIPPAIPISDVSKMTLADLSQFNRVEHEIHGGKDTVIEPDWMLPLPYMGAYDKNEYNGYIAIAYVEYAIDTNKTTPPFLTLWYAPSNVQYSIPRPVRKYEQPSLIYLDCKLRK